MGLEMRLVFPYLGLVAMLILSMMATGQLVWEFFDPSRRYQESWISRASDYAMSVAYTGALLSIPSIYYDAWKAGIPGPHASHTAETILYIIAVSFTMAVFRVSVRPAFRLWRYTKGLPMINRCLRTLRALFCPFRGPDVFSRVEEEMRRAFSGNLKSVTETEGDR